MSLVAGSREVSLGPIIGFQGDVVATPTAYVSKEKVVVKGGGGTGEEKQGISYLSAYLMNDVKEEKKEFLNRNNGFYFGRKNRSEGEELSSASSSIGDPDESDEEHEEQEVQSKLKADLGSLGSLNSLEESLPIKRGLSNFFTGKSKSFASLSQVSMVNDLAKPENPYNKRRRTLLACKLSSSRRGGLYTSINPTSMPLLALNEDDQEIQTDEEQEQEIGKNRDPDDFKALPDLHVRRKFKNFKSKSCFFITDLQKH